MNDSHEHLPSAKPASRRDGWRIKFDMLVAAACLLGAVIIYSTCLLLGEPLYGFEDPARVLVMRLPRLAWALLATAAIGLLLRSGLSTKAERWQKAVAVALLVASPVFSVICNATHNEGLMYFVPIWWIEVTLWPVLAALLARVLLLGERPTVRETASYFALCLVYIALATCVEHDYLEFFFLGVVAIGVWYIAVGGAERFDGRGRAALALIAAGCLAAALAIVSDWRFWDILLGEPAYAASWASDRLESARRFITFYFALWDCPADRNALFLVSNVAGSVASVVYAALSLASAVFMARACGKLVRRMQKPNPATDYLVVTACGIAYTACIVTGLSAEFFNISTCIGPTQGLGTVPTTILLIVALFGRRMFEGPQESQGESTPEIKGAATPDDSDGKRVAT